MINRYTAKFTAAFTLAIVAAVTTFAVSQEGENRFGDVLLLPVSPNANGPLSNVTAIATPKKHTHYTFEEALAIPPVSLAQGVTELSYILRLMELAKQGATVYTWVDQPKQMVDSENVEQIVALVEQRLADYRRATEERGYATMARAYEVVTRDVWIPALVEQDKGDFTWWDGEALHTGAIVEDTFVVANDVRTEEIMIGRLSTTDRIKVKVWSLDWINAKEEVVSEMLWHAKSGNEAVYAIAFASRALFYLNLLEYDKALRDANEALKRSPGLTLPLAVRSQIYSSCPIPRLRNAELAVADATRYCQLNQNQPVEQWACDAMLAAAFAEQGDFLAAVTEVSLAIDKAPDSMKDSLRADLKNYSRQVPRRMPTNGQ